MCGIIGYTGNMDADKVLLEGLSLLEYRGYDSAGIAVVDKGAVAIRKSAGKVEVLKEICSKNHITGKTGIGHTRWATHGAANTVNSHPHTNLSGTVAVVHNGIIENYAQLKEFLKNNGYRFVSDTDSEVIPHLIDYYLKQNEDFFASFLSAVKRLDGSFAVSAVYSGDGDKIISARRGSPLVVGVGEGGNFISSDVYSLLKKVNETYILGEDEIAVVTGKCVDFYNFDGEEITKEPSDVESDMDEDVSSPAHGHYMLREIHQQPDVLQKMFAGITAGEKIKISGITEKDVADIEKIYIVGCGTAYYAAMAGKKAIEYLTGLNVEADVSSEFKYRKPAINEKTLVIAVTQSGETADTLSAMRFATQNGATVGVITNTPQSTADAEADFTVYTLAGREISVASTKAYTAQLAALYMFALFLAESKGGDKEEIAEIKRGLDKIPEAVSQALLLDGEMKKIAETISLAEHIYYIGRGFDYVTACEGALKMKEISYIHAEAYPAGELKHGPIALIDKKTPVIAISTDRKLNSKTLSNVKEVCARGAVSVCLCGKGCDKAEGKVISLPETHWILSPFVAIIPLQLLSYYTALARGCDIDKPRNLAKSVTVE